MRKSPGSGRYGSRAIGVGEFGKWLETRMREKNYTVQEVADILQITRQTVQYHMRMKVCPSFPFVIAYCWVFNDTDDPVEIYELVKRDWAC